MMDEIFREYIKGKSSMSATGLDTLLSYSFEKTFKKKEFILREGDVWQYTAFLCNGCARMFRVDDKGLEHILRFSVETWWVGDRESYTTGNPAQSNIEALEDCDILMWQKKDLDKLHQQIPGLTAFVDGLLARSLNAFHNRVYAMISNTAEEKYNNFIESYPGIFNRVPLHMIASYLGVTRETLSRIRRRHATK